MKKFYGILLFLLCLPILTFATSYPDYNNYVNDFAHVLSPSFVSHLTSELSNFDKKTTNQIAVVTIDTTEPETIEEYGIHLADKWKVGQKGKDNGVIMLFAMHDHKMRIEVGRGLEGDLTDIQAKHIESDIITPAFKKGNYEQGLKDGVDAILGTITHDQHFPANLSNKPSSQHNKNTSLGVLDVLFYLVLFLIFLLITAFSPHTPLGGRGRWGITTFWDGGGDNRGGGDGFGGFGGGGFSGGGSSDSW